MLAAWGELVQVVRHPAGTETRQDLRQCPLLAHRVSRPRQLWGRAVREEAGFDIRAERHPARCRFKARSFLARQAQGQWRRTLPLG